MLKGGCREDELSDEAGREHGGRGCAKKSRIICNTVGTYTVTMKIRIVMAVVAVVSGHLNIIQYSSI